MKKIIYLLVLSFGLSLATCSSPQAQNKKVEAKSDFNPEAIPDFEKELRHFRVMPDGTELVIETLLNFVHFDQPFENRTHENLGVPPPEPSGGLKSSSDEDIFHEKFERKKASAYSRMKLSGK